MTMRSTPVDSLFCDKTALATAGAVVRLVLRSGEILYATIVTPSRRRGTSVHVRAWGARQVRALDVNAIRSAAVVVGMRWERAREIAREQARREPTP